MPKKTVVSVKLFLFVTKILFFFFSLTALFLGQMLLLMFCQIKIV